MARDPAKPSLFLRIGLNDVPDEIMRAIISVEVDLTFGLADQIKLKIANPILDKPGRGYVGSQFAFIDSKAFMPGNQIDVFLGWGDDLQHVSSGIIQKWLPDFPRDGVPTLDILALDASHRLMDGETAGEARSYPNFDLDTVILEIINRHGIKDGEVLSSGFGHTGRESLVKKRGMTDYQFVKSLSNITGNYFAVYYDVIAEAWKAIWKPFASNQTARLHFTWGGPQSTLISFQPEFGLRDTPNEVKLLYYDQQSATFEEVTVGKREPGEDMKFTKKETKDFFEGPAVIQQKIISMSRLRVATGDVSVEIIPQRPFDNQEAALAWATSWLKQRRDNFITGEGVTVGIETLKPGEVHELKGLGVVLDGDWEFRTVRHIMNADRGFETQFSCHKVLTE